MSPVPAVASLLLFYHLQDQSVRASLVVVKGSVSGTAAGGNLRDWGGAL